MWRLYRAFELALKSSFQNLHHEDLSCCQICICPFSTVLNRLFFGPFLGTPGPSLGTPRFSKLVQNLRLGPPTARSTFVPRCSHRLGPLEPSDRHFGQFGLFLGPGGPGFQKPLYIKCFGPWVPKILLNIFWPGGEMFLGSKTFIYKGLRALGP